MSRLPAALDVSAPATPSPNDTIFTTLRLSSAAIDYDPKRHTPHKAKIFYMHSGAILNFSPWIFIVMSGQDSRYVLRGCLIRARKKHAYSSLASCTIECMTFTPLAGSCVPACACAAMAEGEVYVV